VIYRRTLIKRQTITDEMALHKAVKALGKRGITIHAAATPRQLPQTVAANWEAKFQTPPPANLVTGLAAITNSIEQTRYRGIENSLPAADLQQALKQITTAKPVKSKGPR